MFDRGNILYIKEYQLLSRKIKPKYLIILENLQSETIIVTLPTSKQYIDQSNIKKGCIQQHHTHGYYFPSGDVICENGFSFVQNTFVLFRSNVFKEKIKSFTAKYNESGIEVKGKLTNDEYFNLLYCMYRSGVLRPDIENIF